MAGISPAAEAGHSSDRPLTCQSGWPLADRQTLRAQFARPWRKLLARARLAGDDLDRSGKAS